jgi:hypothetical protein
MKPNKQKCSVSPLYPTDPFFIVAKWYILGFYWQKNKFTLEIYILNKKNPILLSVRDVAEAYHDKLGEDVTGMEGQCIQKILMHEGICV